MSTLIETSTGTIDYTPQVGQSLPPRSLRDAWTVLDDGNGVITVALDPDAVHSIMRGRVNVERDRRIDAGFMVDFGGVIKGFDSDQSSRENILGAHAAAYAAINAGALPADLRWFDPDFDFEWICADNSRQQMDAQTCYDLCSAALAYKTSVIFAGNAIKALPTIPDNYDDNAFWPNTTLSII